MTSIFHTRPTPVLIVDDNETNRRILTLQTESWGMVPRAAESANEALSWLRSGERFAIGLLDMEMPEMDGLTLASEIRWVSADMASGAEGVGDFPLVMLSSLSEREATRHAEDEPVAFAATLAKPIKPLQLFDVLAEIFGDEDGRGMRRTIQTVSSFDREMAEQLPLRILLAEDNAICQWRSKKGPPWRCKKGPLGGCGLVPVVHGRAPRATRRALNRLTRRRAREGPVGPRGQAWAGWSVQLAVGV